MAAGVVGSDRRHQALDAGAPTPDRGLGDALDRSRLGYGRVTQPQRLLGLKALRKEDGSD